MQSISSVGTDVDQTLIDIDTNVLVRITDEINDRANQGMTPSMLELSIFGTLQERKKNGLSSLDGVFIDFRDTVHRLLLENGLPQMLTVIPDVALGHEAMPAIEPCWVKLIRNGGSESDLLDHADAFSVSEGQSTWNGMMYAAYYDRPDLIKLFQIMGQDITGQKGKRAPIHEAVSTGSLKAVKCLLELGVDANSPYFLDEVREDTGTPLSLAVIEGNESEVRTDITKLLLSWGANAAICFRDRPLIEWSVHKPSILKVLLDHQRDLVHVRNADHHTALFEAVRQGYHISASILLQYGADVAIKDNNDNTPLGVCLIFLALEHDVEDLNERQSRISDDMRTAHLLEQYGADFSDMESGNTINSILYSIQQPGFRRFRVSPVPIAVKRVNE